MSTRLRLIAEQEKHFPIHCEMHLHTSHSEEEEDDDAVVSWRAVYFNKGTEIPSFTFLYTTQSRPYNLSRCVCPINLFFLITVWYFLLDL